ncbi:MAG: AAA family ATPase [Chlamydiota bacterium]
MKKEAIVYVVGGTKGGPGKSLTAVNLAVSFSQDKKEVLLVDADDQGTAYKFSIQRENQGIKPSFTCIRLSDKAVRTEILKLKRKYDIIVVDVGGRDTISQRAAISVADIFITPCPPISFDVWEIDEVNVLIEEMKEVNPSLKPFVFLNKAESRGKDNQATINYLVTLDNLKYLDAPIVARKAFSNSVAQGLTVNETSKKDKKAINELKRFFNEIKKISI